MNYKKPAFWIIILAVIACVIVAVCFLTNPMGFQFDEATHTIVSANHFDILPLPLRQQPFSCFC